LDAVQGQLPGSVASVEMNIGSIDERVDKADVHAVESGSHWQAALDRWAEWLGECGVLACELTGEAERHGLAVGCEWRSGVECVDIHGLAVCSIPVAIGGVDRCHANAAVGSSGGEVGGAAVSDE